MIRVLGVMTGTSCDGLDASCLELSGIHEPWRVLWNASVPYPKSLKKSVLRFQKPGAKHSIEAVLTLDRDLGDWYGSAISKVLKNQNEHPDAIANHGQTVAHFPAHDSNTLTLQMGDPSRIAVATGLTVISRFRHGDIASGGQGAPLVPKFHSLLARRFGGVERGISIHNMGGVSNMSYFSPSGEVIAFDTGPGGFWIDQATQEATHGKKKMDHGGLLAKSGKPDLKAVKKFLKNPYFSKRPPKSTGRNQFPYLVFKKLTRVKGADLVATATEMTVASIVAAYEKFILGKGHPLHSVYLCGGGAENGYIVSQLNKRMPEVLWKTLSEVGMNNQMIEAQAFAYFGFLALRGIELGGPWTGATQFGPPAQVTPGKNWKSLLKLIG